MIVNPEEILIITPKFSVTQIHGQGWLGKGDVRKR